MSSDVAHVEALLSAERRPSPPRAPEPAAYSLTWGDRPMGSPEVKRMAEPAEKPRRQTVAPGISTWEAVRRLLTL